MGLLKIIYVIYALWAYLQRKLYALWAYLQKENYMPYGPTHKENYMPYGPTYKKKMICLMGLLNRNMPYGLICK